MSNVAGMRHTDDDKYIITVNKLDTDMVFDTITKAAECIEMLTYAQEARYTEVKE